MTDPYNFEDATTASGNVTMTAFEGEETFTLTITQNVQTIASGREMVALMRRYADRLEQLLDKAQLEGME